ncbi:hypothetical protein H6H01_36160 [Nostoc calcicola FACHB-3891]|nr:hypothetical protein [Nostoc calcicola FACHB-3891]
MASSPQSNPERSHPYSKVRSSRAIRNSQLIWAIAAMCQKLCSTTVN